VAISVDASVARWTGTPAGTTAITSASFTPANSSLLVLCVNADEASGTPVTLAVSGGSLTWTERIRRGNSEADEGLASIWTAPVATGASMTISVNRSAGSAGTGRLSAKVYIVTGQHASPIGFSTSANWASNPQTLGGTMTGDGRLFGCGTDWNQTGTPVSTDTEDGADYAGAISVMSAYKAADHTSGSTTAVQFDPVGTPAGNIAVLEIIAAAGGGGATVYNRRIFGSPIFHSNVVR
jgi:hypothetical protein